MTNQHLEPVGATVDALNSIYRHDSQLYYIYSPRWIESSAGIKVLHYLCHALNCAGQDAYLVLSDFPTKGSPRVNPNLRTPILTNEQAQAHFHSSKCPITIYPETIAGNPLGAASVVRYLLNYAGALGGASAFSQDDYVVAFSQNIAKHYEQTSNLPSIPVLFLPPVDPTEFIFNPEKKPFQLVYAGKYRSFIGPPPQVGHLPSVEIFREGKNMQSRDEVKKLLSEASVLYSFENTSLITEAVLSGTPVLLVRSEFFREVIAEHELGRGGVSYLEESEALRSAKDTVQKGTLQYLQSINNFDKALDKFVFETTHYFRDNNQEHPLNLRRDRILFLNHKLTLAFQIWRNKGLGTLFRMVFFYFRRRLGLRALNRKA